MDVHPSLPFLKRPAVLCHAVQEHEEYLEMLRTRLWPQLGVTPAMQGCCLAWVHFR